MPATTNLMFNVFISYSYDNDTIHARVDNLCKLLTGANISRWYDKEKMKRGDVDKLMAEGIDNSTIFICCISYKYGYSDNTRRELKYAIALGKPIMYVVLEDFEEEGLTVKDFTKKLYSDISFYMARILFYKYKDEKKIIDAVKEILASPEDYNPDRLYSIETQTNIPFERVQNFIDKGYCEKLKNLLSSGKNVVLCGPQGIGKTSVVNEFAYRNETKKDYIIHWLFADSLESFESSFVELCADAGLMFTDCKDSKPLKVLQQKIEKSNKKHLFVIDNLTQYKMIKDYQLNLYQKTRFLITTRDRLIVNQHLQGYEIIEPELFSEDNTVKYLTMCLNERADETSIYDIIENTNATKALPYNLEKCVAFIRNFPFEKINDLNQKGNINLMRMNSCENSCDQIITKMMKEPESAKVLRCLRYFEPTSIPVDVLKDAIENDDDTNTNVLNRLLQVSLIDIRYYKTLPCIYLHELTLNRLKANQSSQEQNKEQIKQSILKSLIKNFPKTKNAFSRSRQYVIIYVQQTIHMLTQFEETKDELYSLLYEKLGNYFKDVKLDFKKALEYYKKCLDIQMTLFTEINPSIAKTYTYIGSVYDALKKPETALKYYQECLKIQRNFFKETEMPIAMTYHNIGEAYYSLQKYEQALEYHNKCLEIENQASEKNEVSIATSYKNIAFVFIGLKEFNEALEFLEKCLEIQIKLSNYPSVVTCYNDMGYVYEMLNKPRKQLDCYERSLEIARQFYGENDKRTSDLYTDIGLLYEFFKKPAEALDYYKKSLNIQLKLNEEPNSSIIKLYSKIGSIHKSLKEYAKALENFEECLKIQISFPQTQNCLAISYNNVGFAHFSLGNFERAIDFYSKCLDICIGRQNELFGNDSAENNSFILQSYKNIEQAYRNLGDHAKATEYLNKHRNFQF